MSLGNTQEDLRVLAEQLKDEDLLLRLRNFEDNFVERKSASDNGGWLRTAVAFANSVPIGWPAVLFIGVGDDGTVNTKPDLNLETLQKKFSGVIKPVYPSIFYFPRVLTDEGKQFLAIIIPGSPLRPHFAGRSYIRVGPETREASEKQFESLIAQRQSKVYQISQWVGKAITVRQWHGSGQHISSAFRECRLVDCNALYVTYAPARTPEPMTSVPLQRVEVSYDHDESALRLEIRDEL